jgi:hypothetical protein
MNVKKAPSLDHVTAHYILELPYANRLEQHILHISLFINGKVNSPVTDTLKKSTRQL